MDKLKSDSHVTYMKGKSDGKVVENYLGQNKKYWTKDPISFNGSKVYQRDNLFDLHRIDKKTGKTNKELMKEGKAPYGNDGQKINLHHMTQKQSGAIIEVTNTFHKQNSNTLHINSGTRIPSGINRSQFNSWKKKYWKDRVQNLLKRS